VTAVWADGVLLEQRQHTVALAASFIRARLGNGNLRLRRAYARAHGLRIDKEHRLALHDASAFLKTALGHDAADPRPDFDLARADGARGIGQLEGHGSIVDRLHRHFG